MTQPTASPRPLHGASSRPASVMVTSADPSTASTDAVLVTVHDGGLSTAAAELDGPLDGLLGEMRESKEISAGFGECRVFPSLGRVPARRIAVLGLGDVQCLDTFRLHNAYRMAGERLRGAGVSSVTAFVDDAVARAVAGQLDTGTMPARTLDTVLPEVTVQARAVTARSVATGLLLANQDSGYLRSTPEHRPLLVEIVLAGDGIDDGALGDVEILADATNRARTWATQPGNVLTPSGFADEARRLVQDTAVQLEVLDRARLEELGCGALLGVARGSHEPPVMLALRYDGAAADAPRLALVGKGITFDSGGISLKPALGMELMKWDMAGGAAVIAAMRAVADLHLPVNLIGVVPATENMPGGRACKPGDVLTSLSGMTIEVTNTDAEGRVVLADAVAYAKGIGATHIVDVATLTGAMVVALGHVTAGIMGNHRGLLEMVTRAAHLGGDRVTEFPLHPEYETALKSRVADVKNAAGRQAGAITAGLFIRRFVGEVPWVHVDIAGVVWNDQGDLTQVPRHASGAPVRTLVQLARLFGDSPPAT